MEGVLICNDEQLRETAIKDAHHIIHYTVPNESFRAFVSRLATMLDNFKNGAESKVSENGEMFYFVGLFCSMWVTGCY